MESRPGPAGRTRFDIGDIVRQHRAAFEAEYNPTLAQRRVLSAISLCRTAALGGHLDVCRSCGHNHPSYNSCRNRHCPKCQALAQEKWIAARTQRQLPVKHFHVVFTLPRELRGLARNHSRAVFAALFSAASQTLTELGQSRLGGRLGITMVLHTWTRDLRFHPHLHCIVTAGGLTPDGSRFAPSNPKFLFPVKVMGLLLRGKMMANLRGLKQKGLFDARREFTDPAAFQRLMAQLARKPWVVYAKKPFQGVEHVLAYLGRYTHRVAIANSRIVNVSNSAITFRTKDGKTVTLPALVFIRRFVQHVLPGGFHKIRHYGLYAAALGKPNGPLHTARRLLIPSTENQPTPGAAPDLSWSQRLLLLTGRDISVCPSCGGQIQRLPLPRSQPRAPPLTLATL